MVTLLNPPTPRDPPVTPSDALVLGHERRVDAEIQQLLLDIRRIGPTYPPPEPNVLFGELFDDDNVQQYYEALVGTLKCAKKRGVITFKGQMLLKGMSDDVKISIVEDKDTDNETKTEIVDTNNPSKNETLEEPKAEQESAETESKAEEHTVPEKKPTNSASDEPEASLKRQSPLRFKFDSFRGTTPTSSPVITSRKGGDNGNNDAAVAKYPSPLQTCSPFSHRQSTSTNVSPYRSSPLRSSPIVSKRKKDIAGSTSDGETEVFTFRQYQPPPPIGTCSDSEVDGHTPSRGRVTLPSVFLAQKPVEGRPPAPWRMRKAKSSMNVTKSSENSRRKSIGAVPENKPLARKKELKDCDENNAKVPTMPTNLSVDTTVETIVEAPDSPPNTKENEGPSSKVASRKPVLGSNNNVTRAACVKQKSLLLSKQASMRVDSQVHQLVDDIRRVGSNPGVPCVTFGELFDDETVQDTYEALIGTLRSAKRQGYIHFKGQILFKGMHDDVVINVVDEQTTAGSRSESVA